MINRTYHDYNTAGKQAELAQKYSASSVIGELGPGDPVQRCDAPDITRTGKELGFKSCHQLEEGIQRYADWMKKPLG